MNHFARRVLKKIKNITVEQSRDVLRSAVFEIELLESVLDSLENGILVCDAHHHLLLANKRARHVFPVNFEHGPVWSKIKNDTVRNFFKTALLNGEKIESREFPIELNTDERLYSFSILHLVLERRVSGSLIIFEDITEHRKEEIRLRRAESLASLTTLAAGVAHEIKNPLGSLSIHVQLIQKALDKSQALSSAKDTPIMEETSSQSLTTNSYYASVHKYLGIINEEIDRLNKIVVNFLFAVRPMHIDFREGNINALIVELTTFVSYELEASNIECKLDLAPDIPPVKFDERYIKQTLLNLVKNAKNAMPEGGCLSIKTAVRELELFITISDTGVGIPEKNISKIFEPYFTTNEAGSGLGLTLAFKIIREHNGELSVKSREGEGTSFIIRLPIPQKHRRLLSYAHPK
ncbi:PAS domain-containing sensor histidine kinase [Spirochaetia bacterium]|nr:PAS domain-containing sensor histidine kinase [Spirochaetia bacterium]